MYGVRLKPNNEVYVKFVRSSYFDLDYKTGMTNSYGHKLICLLGIYDKEVIKCDSFREFIDYVEKYKKGSLFKRFLAYIEKKLSNYLERSVKNGR